MKFHLFILLTLGKMFKLSKHWKYREDFFSSCVWVSLDNLKHCQGDGLFPIHESNISYSLFFTSFSFPESFILGLHSAF